MSFKDWQECVLYTFYTVNYYDEQLFNEISKRCNKFKDFEELQFIAINERHNGAFVNLTFEGSSQNLNRVKLENMAFQASLDKKFKDIIAHFIQSSTKIFLTWDQIRQMLENDQIDLIKQCIKNRMKLEGENASIKKIVFAGRASAPLEDQTIRLVDLLHVMLEQKWNSSSIRNLLIKYSEKSRLSTDDVREVFLLFAIKRKVKLMSFMINADDDMKFPPMEFTEDNFIDVIENSAYDMGVLLQREYFLLFNNRIDKIINLLVNSFSETNGMLESKAYLMKRYISKMSYEQATTFLTAIEKSVQNKSRGNILLLTLNVVKASCLLIELLEYVRKSFGFLDRRINEIRQEIVSVAKEYMNRVENEEEMQYLLLENDIDNRDSLMIIYDYEIVELLENPYAQKIVLNIWESPYNVSSSLFAVSSVYNLLFNFNHCRFDAERKWRWTQPKNLKDFGSHMFQFEVWRRSAKSRYFMMAIGFLLNSLYMHEYVVE